MKRDTPHLTGAQRDELRGRLRRRAWALADEIAASLHSGSLEIEARERESGDVEAAVTAAAAERDTAELRAIEAVLARMEAGTYGLCADCGAAMPWVRLQAAPEALRCTACEHARESRSAAPATL
jgi:DnaK suppressor protein